MALLDLLQATKQTASHVGFLSDETRQELLQAIATALESRFSEILAANQEDLNRMDTKDPKYDRLLLNEERLQSLVQDVRRVAELPDPTGKVLLERTLANGIELQKISVPLGVVGVIYEARPNVTADVAALCLRSGNAVVLRGGSDAESSNKKVVQIIHEVLTSQGIPSSAVQLLPTDRALVKPFLQAQEYVDILIPRGSAGLISFVREHAKIPTIETGAGVCHTFVERSADLEKAVKIIVNAKVQRPSVCNCLDTILVDQPMATTLLPRIARAFDEYEVELFADEKAHTILHHSRYRFLQKAAPSDFGREFLSLKASVKVVDGLGEALAHIAQYSSRHSEAIVAEDEAICERFLQSVDAAAVYSNASTRFTDGSVFGLGAEIGISTQKLHARGPFALEKLVTEKWILRGDGQIR